MPGDVNPRAALLFSVGALALAAFLIFIQAQARPGSAAVTVGSHSYFVLLATDAQQWQHGLMGYTFACRAPGMCVNGMLFVFPSSGNVCFWMKDTPEPLIQVWIDNGTVTNVYNATPKSTTSVCAKGDAVLELYSRLPYNISVGSRAYVRVS